MNKTQIWIYISIAVLIAVLANSISAIWAGKESKLSGWLFALVIISPFVFITFGLVAAKLGLAVSSATIDTLLTIATIVVGLVFFGEWKTATIYQYLGITLAIIGIVLMHIKK